MAVRAERCARELDAERFNRVEDGLFPELAESGRAIFGYRHDGFWADIGNPEAYLETNLELLAGAVPALLPDGWPADGKATGAAEVASSARIEGAALLGEGTRIGEQARLEGGVIAGAGCAIERGALVAGSVLWDGVTVGEGAAVRGSVLAEGARVGAGAVVEGAVIAHGAVVEASERPPAGIRLDPEAVYWSGEIVEPPTPKAGD